MKLALAAAVLVCLSLTGTVLADLDVGTYAPDIEAKEWLNNDGKAISLPELRGMVVVLYFWVSYSKGGEYLMPLINQVENAPQLGRRRGVFVMGVTESEKKRVIEMIKDERILFPIAVESPAAKEYKIDDFPRAVVIDPNGKIVYSGWPGSTKEGSNELVKKILDVVVETPPTRTHPREAAEALKCLERAREFIRAGDYKSANTQAKNALERAITGDPLKVLCQNMVDLIEAIGRDRLADGMKLLDEKKYAEAVAVLRDVERLFRGMASGKTAKKRLDGVRERYPEVKKVLEGLNREAEARGLLVGAQESLRQRDFGQAYDQLQKLLKDYSDSKVTGDAKTILARMEKNQTIMGYVRDHLAEKDCNNWLNQANSFIQTGNLAKAKELLRKIIDKYPDTVWEERAREKLREMP